MTYEKKSMFQVIGEFAKETAIEGKERLRKWAEVEKIKKHKYNTERKDNIGNQILYSKNEIADMEEKVNFLLKTSTEEVNVDIDGIDFTISIHTILGQYEETLKTLLKRKEKLIKEFLHLEEKINNDKEMIEKINLMEEQKEERYKTIKTPTKETSFAELLPLILDIPNFLRDEEEMVFEDAFGSIELRFKENRLEYSYNGIIIHIETDMFGDIEQVGIVDWRNDEAVYLAKGSSDKLTELNWIEGSAFDYTNEFFEMVRALKYMYANHFTEKIQ